MIWIVVQSNMQSIFIDSANFPQKPNEESNHYRIGIC